MADNNKISIDVTVSGDGQKQIDNYVKSFDSLRNSINGLSQPFNSFSNNLSALDKNLSKYTESLSKLNDQHNDAASGSDKMYDKVTNTSSSFVLWNEVVKVFSLTLKGWGIALSGGLGVITAFLPEIINFATALFKGKDAVNAMATNFKNLNEVMKGSNKDAASQITRLQILYKSATDVNSSYADRLKSVKELKREFPAHLKGIKDEDILNGNSKKSYNELTQSIFENARAKAALNKMTEEANKMLDADFQIEKIKNANFNEKKRYEREAAAAGNGSRGVGGRYPLELYKKDSDERARIAITEQEQIKNKTKNSIDYLMKFAGGANNIARTLSNESVDTANTISQTGSTVHKKSPKPKKTTLPKPDTSRSIEILEAHLSPLLTTFEEDKKHYDKDLVLLDDQLNKKLISQAEYNKQSEQLQETYHQNIGAGTKAFIKDSMDATVKHLKDIAEADGYKAGIENDEKNVKKAILPAQKLDAEKQLITDKYAYEISLANGNTEKIKQLEIDKQQALNDVAQQYEQQRKEFALNTAQQVSDKAFSIISNNIKSLSDAKIKGLEAQKTSELSNTSLTATQRKAIEDKYKKKESEEKVKAFKAEQRASVLQAVVNGALAITKATAQTGILAPFVIPAIIASTALQVATIISQKPPAFAKGGQFVSDGRGALLPGYSRTDNTNAYLRSGEAVVVSEAMRNPWARNLVSAINVAHGGRDFSMPNTGRGYAIGGIFTDGGNANRYYNQPVNDIKDMANTLAYQMINNFPPIYVDVKDVNNQQNILAQTVNRVNL